MFVVVFSLGKVSLVARIRRSTRRFVQCRPVSIWSL